MRASGTQWAPSTTPLPPSHRRHRHRCPCSECCVRRELSTPGEVGFPAKAALAVGLVVRGLRGREGAGQRTVEHRHSVSDVGGIVWVIPRGGRSRRRGGSDGEGSG